MAILTKIEVEELIYKNPCNFHIILKSKHLDFYNMINEYYTCKKYSEKIYRWLNDNKCGKCKNCGKPTTFLGMNKGYSNHCSYECSNGNKHIQELKKQSYLKKYGVDNPSKSIPIKQKKIDTCTKHFGTDCNLKLDVTKKSIRETCNKKYGTDSYTQSNEYKQQRWSEYYNELKNGKFENVLPSFTYEEYHGYQGIYKFLCTKCNTEFFDRLNYYKRNPTCRKCHPIHQSAGQTEIFEYIKNHFDDVIQCDRKTVKGIELDIYIPSKKIAIEYNGNYYHSELTGGKNQKYHVNKTDLCESQGIQLIQIFEDEYLSKKQIVINKINNLLKIKTEQFTKYYARNCDIKLLSSKECDPFLTENHIQGSDKSSIKIGMYYNDRLTAVMTFGKLRLSMGNKKCDVGTYELYRYCTKNLVVGGASKLLSYFIKTYKPTKIISYADRRWSIGKLYDTLNFKLVSKTKPNYWYTKDHVRRYYRFKFRKSELPKMLDKFNPNLTEWKNMQLNGWDRIWDCGSLKYELLCNVTNVTETT